MCVFKMSLQCGRVCGKAWWCGAGGGVISLSLDSGFSFILKQNYFVIISFSQPLLFAVVVVVVVVAALNRRVVLQ